jgi:hypothetical protein
MRKIVARIVVLAFSICSVACATSVPGQPEMQHRDGVVELREPLSFRLVLEGSGSVDPEAGEVEMLDYMGFVVVGGSPFLTVATVESVSASRIDADHVVDILLTESDGRTFLEWAAAHSGQKVVATTTKSAWGYADLAEQRRGEPVRLDDNYTGKDATDIMNALVG